MGIKIRNLKVKDCRFLTRVFKKLITDMKEIWIQETIKVDNDSDDSSEESSDEKKKKSSMLFLLIIEKALDCFEDELSVWLASLLDMSIDEYMNLPFDTDMKVFRQVIEDENFSFFLRKLSALFNMSDQSGSIIQMLKERYDLTTD